MNLDAVAAVLEEVLSLEIPPSDLKALAELFETESYAEGDTIFDEHSRGDQLYLIPDGQVEILLSSYESADVWKAICTIGPHVVLGELSFIDRRPRSARAICRTAMEMPLLHRERFFAFAEVRPDLAWRFTMALAADLSRKLRFTDLALKDKIA